MKISKLPWIYIGILNNDVPQNSLTVVTSVLEDGTCICYCATKVLLFLLSLAGRPDSRTGNVAIGHMVV